MLKNKTSDVKTGGASETEIIVPSNQKLTFTEKVRRAVTAIPKGETRTYREVARIAGSPSAFRTVGNILNKNYDPAIPCHRVIRSDGSIGGYNRGARKKAALLKQEGALEVC